MNTIITALEAYKKIHENAGKRMQTVRDCTKIPLWRGWRQGDVYGIMVDEIENRGPEIKERQLVPGVSLGARHVVADNPHVRLFRSNPEKLIKRLEKELGIRILPVQIGPAIEAESEWVVTHPTHPNCKNREGKCQIFYQIDPVTRQRAQD